MTCGRPLKAGQWWHFCGETDMGQTAPALCTNCGGPFELAPPGRQAEHEAHKARVERGDFSTNRYIGTYTGNGSTQTIPNSLSTENCSVIIKRRGAEMSRDDIIRMAREAGFTVDEADFITAPKSVRMGFQLEIERFAALVHAAGEQAERDRTKRLVEDMQNELYQRRMAGKDT